MIGIVILNYRNWEDTLRCIRSIVQNPPTEPYKIILVDNASPNKPEYDLEETIDDTESVVDGIFNRNGFYGVWLYASDNEEDAYNFANQLTEQGFAGCVTQSNLWSNLNSEPYYVVTYGAYESEEIAQGQLANIQDLYSDAYVKFSGEYVGN